MRYILSADKGPGLVDATPKGWEFHESVHGHVVFRRERPPVFSDLENHAIRRVMESHDDVERCKFQVENDDSFVFYVPQPPDYPDISGILVRLLSDNELRYEPALRLKLVDEPYRKFVAERRSIHDSRDSWRELERGSLLDLAKTYIPEILTAIEPEELMSPSSSEGEHGDQV